MVVGLAMWVELSLRPAWWVHGLLWLPLTLVATLAALRVAKALLLGLEYRHKAAEGRLDHPE